jgi:hypothetical protein
VTTLPKEAREGLMRAWLKVLRERHPAVTWVPVSHQDVTKSGEPATRDHTLDELANSA